MLLARSMTIAFVPGVLLAATLALGARRRTALGTRVLNLCLLIATGTALAATWYAPNLTIVLDYLTGYGYGAQSVSYGTSPTVLSWERLRTPLAQHRSAPTSCSRSPQSSSPASSRSRSPRSIASSVPATGAERWPDWPDPTRSRLRSSSSPDTAPWSARGTAAFGFTLPLAVLLPPLAVIALRLHPRAAAPALAAVAAVVCLNLVSSLGVSEAITRNRTVDVPGLGELSYCGRLAARAEHDPGSGPWPGDALRRLGPGLACGRRGRRRPAALLGRSRRHGTAHGEGSATGTRSGHRSRCGGVPTGGRDRG